MNAFDFDFLTTGRLQLRMLADDDAPALLALYGDAQVMRHWSHGPWTDIAQAHAAIREARDDLLGGRALHLAIAPCSGEGLIGSCALFDVAAQHRRATLGYLLAPAYWGQGLAREALRALLAYGIEVLGLQRIEAEVDPRNGASQALLLRLGFRREGLMHARWRVGDEARDVELWALPARA